MSGYNELDDILISLRQRREENEAGESATPEVPPKAKSRVQRAAEEAERQRLEQERLRKEREEKRKAQEERERRERELREKEMRERLERERKAREEAERERQRKKELERAQLERQHAQWRAAQAKLKEEQEKERQKLLEEEIKKEKSTQLKENTKSSKTEDEAQHINLKKESDKPPIDEPKKTDEQGEADENKAVNNLLETLPDDNNTEAENNEEPLSPPKDDKRAAKKAAKRAKLEAELLARRLKAEEKQRKKDEKKRLKKEKQKELAPPERKDEKSDEDNSKSDESNLTVDEKAAEELNTDNAAVPIEKADTEDLKENAEQQADTDDEQEDEFVWYKSVEHKSPKKSIKEKLSPEKIKAGIKKSVNTVFVKPFVFVKEMFRDEIFPAAGRSFKKMLTKQFAIFLAVVVVIGAAGYGGYRLYEYSRVAYLNSYKKEFPGVEFPEGILEEMCGEYGKNQNVVCKISPKDKDEFVVATSDKEDNYAYAYPSFDVKNEQQFQSIDVSNVSGFDNLESLYSTRDAFLDSSQMYDLTTLYSKSSYRVIAAYYTNTVATDDAGYVFPYNCYGNMTEKSFRSYVDKIKSRRLYDTGYNFSYDDNFLSISADSDFMPNFKFVVLCVKNTQKNTEKSTTAIDNESVHYPQAWYDKNGETNPYRFSSNWYPEIYTDDNSNTKRLTSKDFQ